MANSSERLDTVGSGSLLDGPDPFGPLAADVALTENFGEDTEFDLELDTLVTGSFGNAFNGATASEGVVTATFTGTVADLTLTFDGFDIDNNTEVEVLVNGESKGFLDQGQNDGLTGYRIDILAADQNAGVDNTIEFVQRANVGFKWGVTNVMLKQAVDADFELTVGEFETGKYGEDFDGTADGESVIATFEGTGGNLLLNFDAFDVEPSEIEVFVNGASKGVLSEGANDAKAPYQVSISAADQTSGQNTIEFKQLKEDTGERWGVTDVILREVPNPDLGLTVGVQDDTELGNGFNGAVDADGRFTLGFTGTTADLTFSFEGFDIDTSTEVELFLNGVSLGFLPGGTNNGLADYAFDIAADDQLFGTNVLEFVQTGNPVFAWGATSFLLDNAAAADFTLTEGVPETGKFGNSFDGATDADGVVTALFADTDTDIVLTFDGFDIDTDDEVEVFLNGVSKGFLDAGKNDGLTPYSIDITAAEQQVGNNTITFVQSVNPIFKWGVTNIEIDTPAAADFTLALDTLEEGKFGNSFDGATDADGIVTATFTGTTEDLTLTFDGFDIDTDEEVEVLVNGESKGFIDRGPNNGTAQYSIDISADEQNVGVDNEIQFIQRDNVIFKWGVTNLLLEAATPISFELELGEFERGKYGNQFDGASEGDSVFATFEGTDGDLRLNFDAFDIDTSSEVDVFLNGAKIADLAPGVGDDVAAYEVDITAADQIDGTNTLEFKRVGGLDGIWGVTDVLVREVPAPDLTLALDTLNTSEVGNLFNAATDADGRVSLGFDGTGTDLSFTFQGFDIDTDSELQLLLNGVSLGFLPGGVNDGLSSYEFEIPGADQLAGVNVLELVQTTPAFKWGATDFLLEAATDFDVELQIGTLVTDSFGNAFNGTTDADGVVTAVFQQTGTDLTLSFDGFDVDTAEEIEVFVNGNSKGFLPAGPNDGFSNYEIEILASDQVGGENKIEFKQQDNVAFKWGVTNILLQDTVTANFELELDTVEEGEFGQFGTAADGNSVVAAFDGTGSTLLLNFNAFDIDDLDEVEIFVNGSSKGFLAAGTADGLTAYQIQIDPGDQIAGTNTVEFRYDGNPDPTWGITDVLLREVPSPDLTLDFGLPDNTELGNSFNGATDADGRISVGFESQGTDVTFSFDGFDIDNSTEVELLLNGVSLGLLPAGVNDGLQSYSFDIDAEDQLAGTNVLELVQKTSPAFKWGATNFLVDNAAGSDFTLTLGTAETGTFGNLYDGKTDADGVITAAFLGTADDLTLTFDGFDIDTDAEVEVVVNGKSFGFLDAGNNEGITPYSIEIPAADQNLGEENTIEFIQRDNVAFKWGVTNVLLANATAGDVALTLDTLETVKLGNAFDGATDADGIVTATFPQAGVDLVLAFDGFDIDNGTEVEVVVNGNSKGFLFGGVNNGLQAYEIAIDADDQVSGTNEIQFIQRANVGFAWGVTNFELRTAAPSDFVLDVGTPELGEFGNDFNGATDVDGVVTAGFTNLGGNDLVLTFDAFDIDDNSEVEVFVNGKSLGFIDRGTNNGLESYEIEILSVDQVTGFNTIEFVQQDNPTFRWGVTNVLLQEKPDVRLDVGTANTTEFGEGFGDATDADGELRVGFVSTGFDKILTLEAFDVDSATELEVLLNGVSIGFVTAGADGEIVEDSFDIIAGVQVPGLNVLTFRSTDTGSWGVTDLLVRQKPETDFTLALDTNEDGEFGNNFNGATDDDGIVVASFQNTGSDLALLFDGFDIDFDGEVAVLLNDVSIGTLGEGIDEDLRAYSGTITAGQQLPGENFISFVQQDQPTNTWGVTNVEITEIPQTDVVLTTNTTEEGEFGNNFEEATDDDGLLTARFTGSDEDLLFNFTAFDIDVDTELEVLLNGNSLGSVAVSGDDATVKDVFTLSAEDQERGPNVLTFQFQDLVPDGTWGVTDLLVREIPVTDIVLDKDVPETGEFGNNFNGTEDEDGIVTASFDGQATDLLLTFDAFDVDTADEIEVLLNGDSIGFLGVGENEALESYSGTIDAEDQLPGVNVISFVQRDNPSFTWGVTNILIEDAPVGEAVLTEDAFLF